MTRNPLPGVTSTGWTSIIMAPQFAGSYSVTVSDGTITDAVAMTVNGC